MALEGTVKLPVFGTVSKQTAAATGGGAVILVLGIWWYRQRKASRAAAATAASGAPSGGMITDPAGNSCAAANPATGFCPGTPEDQQAQAGGGAGAFNTTGLGGGLSGFYYGSGGPTGPAVPGGPPGPGNFADNAEWAQYAENYMITTLGADPAATGSALGKYITGQPVDPAAQNIIQEAIAIAGSPPGAGPGGHPPGIKTGGGPPPPPPPPPQRNVTVPYLLGERVENANSALAALGLRSVFGARRPRTAYTVTATSPKAGAKVARGSTVHLSIAPVPATAPRPLARV